MNLTGWTLAFDLDGTLVETAPDLIGVLNVLLPERGYPTVPLSSARHLISGGVKALLATSTMLESEFRAIPEFSSGLLVGLMVTAALALLVGMRHRSS